MKFSNYLFTLFLIIAGQSIYGQNGCEDLSQSFNYRLEEGTLHILKGIATTDNGMLMVGTMKSGDDGGAGGILIKLSVKGDVEWARKLTNKKIGEQFDVTSVIQLTDGKFAVAYRYGTPLKRKIGVIKLAEDGQKIWEMDYRNNYGTSTADPIFLINAINEGRDGDLILNVYEGSDHRVKNGPGFTRIDSRGNVIWSIQYFGKIQIDHHNENAYKDGKLTFWGLVFEESCNGRSFFNSISIDYNTTDIEKVIQYCISPENKDISAVPDVQSTSFEHRSGFLSIGQANGETRLLMQNLNLDELLFSRFDESLNFISAWRFEPHMIDSRFWFSHKAVDKMGNLVFRVSTVTGNRKNYLAHLKNGSKVPEQFIFDESEGRVTPFLEFQNNGRVTEIINKNGFVSVNTLPDYLDVAFFCKEGIDTTFGRYEDYQLTQHTIDYKWEEIRRRVYSAVPSQDIQFTPVAIIQTPDCEKISYCDELKITGDDKICFEESNRVQFTSEKKRFVQTANSMDC